MNLLKKLRFVYFDLNRRGKPTIVPAGSFAWRVKKESFMAGVDFVDDLTMRGSF